MATDETASVGAGAAPWKGLGALGAGVRERPRRRFPPALERVWSPPNGLEDLFMNVVLVRASQRPGVEPPRLDFDDLS
jgi:hypothetical protein